MLKLDSKSRDAFTTYLSMCEEQEKCDTGVETCGRRDTTQNIRIAPIVTTAEGFRSLPTKANVLLKLVTSCLSDGYEAGGMLS